MKILLDCPIVRSLGLNIHDHPASHVRWDDLRAALGSRYDEFCERFGRQSCLQEGAFPHDAERVLKSMGFAVNHSA